MTSFCLLINIQSNPFAENVTHLQCTFLKSWTPLRSNLLWSNPNTHEGIKKIYLFTGRMLMILTECSPTYSSISGLKATKLFFIWNLNCIPGDSTLCRLFSTPLRRSLAFHLFSSGWGKTSYKGQFSTMLREASVPFVAASICTKANKGLFDGVEVNPVKHICVGYGKHSTENGCNGDSGGPLMVQSKNGRWLLVGIMSWGEPECSSQRTDSYTVFTSISPYLSWIKSVLNR